MLSVLVEDSLVKMVDDFVSSSGLYSSRSEFLKDSIRNNLKEKDAWRKDFMKSIEEIRKKARAHGWNGKPLSRKERERGVLQYVKENGIKVK